MAQATMKDIARESGWSLGTVSRVLNQVPGVCEQAQKEVREAALRLGYRKNENAAALPLKHPAGIVLIVRAFCIPVYESLARALYEALASRNGNVRLVFAAEDEDETEKALELMKTKRPCLILFFGARRESLRRNFGRISVPAISVGADMQELPFSSLSDFYLPDTEILQQAAELLFEKGREKIGLILGDRFSSSELADRFLGIQYAFYSRNRVFRAREQSVIADLSMQGGYEAMKILLERQPDLDALLVLNEKQAAGALRAAADLERKVPEDIFVIALDESGLGRFLIPSLSAIVPDYQTLASRLENTVQTFLLNRFEPDPKIHEPIEWKMLWGESCPETAES